MPTYNFACDKCECIWDELTAYDAEGKYEGIVCPECGSEEKEKLITTCNVSFSNSVGTDRWTSDRAGHDYRHNWNMDRPGGVRDQRKHAEANSHMGANPYTDTTKQDIELDGKILDR